MSEERDTFPPARDIIATVVVFSLVVGAVLWYNDHERETTARRARDKIEKHNEHAIERQKEHDEYTAWKRKANAYWSKQSPEAQAWRNRLEDAIDKTRAKPRNPNNHKP